ncbi:MAG TPA: PAS domain S-box protein [Terriglobia bacterium]|nr:PAS domain S-box protein [Terriglobia bacterium]
MMEFFRHLFDSDFMPHGMCYFWNPQIVWLHVASDSLIFLAYTSIPITLVYFARKRRDLPFRWMFLMFGLFIVGCGATHLMEVWTIWHGTYRLTGLVKAVTALASVSTAVLLVKLVPEALALPSPAALRVEVANRKRAQEELERAKEGLETTVGARTRELRELNEQLTAELIERRRAEEELRLQTQALEAAANGILITDPEGRMVWVNAAVTTLTGYTAGELLGKNPRILKSGQQDETFYRDLWTTIQAGQAWRGEIVNRRKDGSLYAEEQTITPVRAQNGAISHFIAVKQDVTERKRTEEKIRKLNEELEERVRARTAQLAAANKELEAFSYSVSHDLRAPLRHIAGFSRILVEEYGPGLDAAARGHLERVQAGAQQMGRLIDDLLNLAQVGRLQLSCRVAGLDSLVEEVLKDLGSDVGDREIDWQIGELPSVECDPGLVRQVFVNLLSNAVKYTRPRPRAVIQVGQTAVGDEAAIFVRDNGVGFSMKYADKLFGVFQRLHLAEDFEGTGIGLATVQRIVHKHGGRIWAEAELDKGATFYFTLGPRGGADETPGPPEPALASEY